MVTEKIQKVLLDASVKIDGLLRDYAEDIDQVYHALEEKEKLDITIKLMFADDEDFPKEIKGAVQINFVKERVKARARIGSRVVQPGLFDRPEGQEHAGPKNEE